ncbi:unnamed protein product [Bemisia tabaci]|uniref:Uncharacterized protein n=1 Tax=Bemisia tabaci TaxID=7038 RepID=A0A9P0ACB4_BEMTA|nr:unnamed protein product [Bemisia tabaci]
MSFRSFRSYLSGSSTASDPPMELVSLDNYSSDSSEPDDDLGARYKELKTRLWTFIRHNYLALIKLMTLVSFASIVWTLIRTHSGGHGHNLFMVANTMTRLNFRAEHLSGMFITAPKLAVILCRTAASNKGTHFGDLVLSEAGPAIARYSAEALEKKTYSEADFLPDKQRQQICADTTPVGFNVRDSITEYLDNLLKDFPNTFKNIIITSSDVHAFLAHNTQTQPFLEPTFRKLVHYIITKGNNHDLHYISRSNRSEFRPDRFTLTFTNSPVHLTCIRLIKLKKEKEGYTYKLPPSTETKKRGEMENGTLAFSPIFNDPKWVMVIKDTSNPSQKTARKRKADTPKVDAMEASIRNVASTSGIHECNDSGEEVFMTSSQSISAALSKITDVVVSRGAAMNPGNALKKGLKRKSSNPIVIDDVNVSEALSAPSTTSSAPGERKQSSTIPIFVRQQMTKADNQTLNGKVFNLFVRDLQPFSIVEHEGFRDRMGFLAPDYNIRSRKYFSNSMLELCLRVDF